MSDNIPVEIQTEIIKRLPDVKSLIRFRSVSKQLKSLIDSSQFIAGYRARKTQPRSSLLRYTNCYQPTYLSVNDETFTLQKDLAPYVTDLMKQDKYTVVIGYSRGLLCLHAFDKGGRLVLWNPSIRRSVGILQPGGDFSVFGFAVCPVTNEPTIVGISFPWKVQIFTLSSKKWTEIQCRKPRESMTPPQMFPQVVIGSFIYRVAHLAIDQSTLQFMIVSFDLVAKEFKAIDLPDKITNPPTSLILSKLNGSLVVMVPHSEVEVWKMEPDCSFTQLFTIWTPDSCISSIVGFSKNGQLVIQTQERRGGYDSLLEAYDPCHHQIEDLALKVYDPSSRRMREVGFWGQNGSFFFNAYKETLHLLDHPDSCIYPEIS